MSLFVTESTYVEIVHSGVVGMKRVRKKEDLNTV